MTDKEKIKYNLRGIVAGKPSPAIKKIVDSLTPEDMDEAKKELEQEPASEELKAEIKNWLDEGLPNEEELVEYIKETACHFAKWQEKQDQSTIELAEDHAMLAGMEKMKEQMMKNIWKPADGDDLPDIDKEVIVLTQPYPLEGNEYVVSFAHRPNPDGWDGKSLTSGKVEHYTPKTYGKGGWNIPDVKWWLDCSLPNMEED